MVVASKLGMELPSHENVVNRAARVCAWIQFGFVGVERLQQTNTVFVFVLFLEPVVGEFQTSHRVTTQLGVLIGGRLISAHRTRWLEKLRVL